MTSLSQTRLGFATKGAIKNNNNAKQNKNFLFSELLGSRDYGPFLVLSGSVLLVRIQ